MAPLAALGASRAFMVLTCVLHHEVLCWVSNAIARLAIPPRSRLLAVIAAAFCSHLSDLCPYAVALWAKERAAGADRRSGSRGPLDSTLL